MWPTVVRRDAKWCTERRDQKNMGIRKALESRWMSAKCHLFACQIWPSDVRQVSPPHSSNSAVGWLASGTSLALIFGRRMVSKWHLFNPQIRPLDGIQVELLQPSDSADGWPPSGTSLALRFGCRRAAKWHI